MARKPFHKRNLPTFVVVCVLVTALVATLFVGGYAYRVTHEGYQQVAGAKTVKQANKQKHKKKKKKHSKSIRCLLAGIECPTPTTIPTPKMNQSRPTLVVDPSCAFGSGGCPNPTYHNDPPCAFNGTCVTPSPGRRCAQVLTPARNTISGECYTFPNACVPNGWAKDPTCR